MSFKRYRIIFILIFLILCWDGTYVDASEETTKQQQHVTNDLENAQSEIKEGRALLFPRVEYNGQWTPVGRGDPLKDPTYDYMPPVLDRVRYWGEGSSSKNKNDILLLGVPSKKLSTKKDKFSYGPIKRNYYSAPYQSHFSSQLHHQPQQQQQQPQYHPQRLIHQSQRIHATDSHPMMSTHQHHSGWSNNVYHHSEPRPENSINYKTVVRPPVISMSTSTTTRPIHFLPTIPPIMQQQQLGDSNLSSAPTLPFLTSTEIPAAALQQDSGHMLSPSLNRETTKPLLHSILQTETATPFTKKPSSVYQIEFTSNIYNPEAINSMASSSTFTTTYTPTKPSIRPASIKATTKTSTTVHSPHDFSSTSTTDHNNNNNENYFVQPDLHIPWPFHNLIIEGHSKVKTYGSKNDDPLGASMPKIRPIQPKENPIVERVTDTDTRPEYNKIKSKQTAVTSLLSLLDGSFGNFLGGSGSDGGSIGIEEAENTKKLFEGGNKRKIRSTRDEDMPVEEKQEQVVGVSFQVADIRPQIYRKGTVISESLWPFRTADTTR